MLTVYVISCIVLFGFGILSGNISPGTMSNCMSASNSLI